MPLPAAIVLSGIEKQHFDDEKVNELYKKGAKLLKSPSETSLESATSQESGISSMSSGPITNISKNLTPYFELLYKVQNEFQGNDESLSSNDTQEIQDAPEPTKTEIIYGNRNILDLEYNLIKSTWDFQPALLRNGIQFFFDNRSQYSRLLGAEIPQHYTKTCDDKDCSFETPVYV